MLAREGLEASQHLHGTSERFRLAHTFNVRPCLRGVGCIVRGRRGGATSSSKTGERWSVSRTASTAPPTLTTKSSRVRAPSSGTTTCRSGCVMRARCPEQACHPPPPTIPSRRQQWAGVLIREDFAGSRKGRRDLLERDPAIRLCICAGCETLRPVDDLRYTRDTSPSRSPQLSYHLK